MMDWTSIKCKIPYREKLNKEAKLRYQRLPGIYIVIWDLFHKTSLSNKPGLFQLVWL